MLKSIKIALLILVGLFFVIATLEIDVFDYDNTFFDTYDSYVQVDNQAVHHNNSVEQGSIASPEIYLYHSQLSLYDNASIMNHFYQSMFTSEDFT